MKSWDILEWQTNLILVNLGQKKDKEDKTIDEIQTWASNGGKLDNEISEVF